MEFKLITDYWVNQQIKIFIGKYGFQAGNHRQYSGVLYVSNVHQGALTLCFVQ